MNQILSDKRTSAVASPFILDFSAANENHKKCKIRKGIILFNKTIFNDTITFKISKLYFVTFINTYLQFLFGTRDVRYN